MRAMGMRPMIPERSGVVGMAAGLTSRWISTLPSGSLRFGQLWLLCSLMGSGIVRAVRSPASLKQASATHFIEANKGTENTP